jgi:hypothetical protein
LLPELNVAVVVLANEDIVNGRTRCTADAAFSSVLATSFAEPPPPQESRLSSTDYERFAGDYESQSYWARLEVRNGQLIGDISGQPTEFRSNGELNFTADSRLENATPVTFQEDDGRTIVGFQLGAQNFHRLGVQQPERQPDWRAFCGQYGPEFIPLIVSERNGHLYTMTENMADYRLTPINRNACALPPGMYWGEQLVFLAEPGGTPQAVNFAGMMLRRRT